MADFFLIHTAAARLAVFAAVLGALLVLEVILPRRGGERLRRLRWGPNLGMVAAGWVLLRLTVPLGAAGAAVLAQARGIGLFHQLALPGWLAGLLSFVALDALIYGQHRLFHATPWFWRIHRMHHSDIEFDATTALRFHPLELLLSMLIKIGAVFALGAPALAVIAFEIVLNASAMFSHANLRLPPALDRALRAVVVTPDMHRVHHSVHRTEYDSNFGFNLSLWDRLFGSYRAQPADGHATMRIGLPEFRNESEQRFVALLAQPLK